MASKKKSKLKVAKSKNDLKQIFKTKGEEILKLSISIGNLVGSDKLQGQFSHTFYFQV